MRPVVFEGCFGWLHPAAGREGVVLCNPFGYDALCTHRGWRRLAERIAAAGLPVLRFDYPGAGDSLGNEEDPGCVERWIGSIVAAVNHLRHETGVTTITLCGLRLGATLAALAAERLGDVDGLVLLSPVLSGRNYLRELRAHRQSWLSTTAGMNADPIPDTAAYVEAFGFGLHGDDITTLGAVNLQNDTHAPAKRVLLLDANDRTRGTALLERYRANGAQVERHSFDEADRFMLEALFSEEPVEAFSRVVQWLVGSAGVERTRVIQQNGQTYARFADDGIASTAKPVGNDPLDSLTLPLANGSGVERPLLFGAYFGMYCEPASLRADAPAVLFVNTGASHHIGDGRIFVLFARALAAQGIASLRMDVGGVGDSVPTNAAITLDTIYADQAGADARAGADLLVARGHQRVVVFGVCGGAFVGLHACAVHPAIVGCFAVNLQKFIWDGAERTPGTDGLASTRVLRKSVVSLEKWRRVLRGESSLVYTLRGLSRRVGQKLAMRSVELIDRLTGISLVPNEARQLLQRIDAKGVHLRLVYGEYDLGLEELKIQFGSRLNGLRRFARVHAGTLPKLDHALFTCASREVSMADAQRWFFEHFVGTDTRFGEITRTVATPVSQAVEVLPGAVVSGTYSVAASVPVPAIVTPVLQTELRSELLRDTDFAADSAAGAYTPNTVCARTERTPGEAFNVPGVRSPT
ncbi:serine aminopeptidase domain-containing protein [Paraburkholderia sp. DHOC27]|uniref:serine aminopeptidase domain-containing protein n=1 Tax=Paraburkholderia sp. DHOC27 TaxID=2303330 RepID=UPI0015F319E7|nr:alpha/beta hydrolase [Paraburkholderia sp. DHOC27]